MLGDETRLVVDTSAWIELLNGTGSKTEAALASAIRRRDVLLPDLIYHEVLRGLADDRAVRLTTLRLEAFLKFNIGGFEIAKSAAAHYRRLRAKGITIRGTIDLLIGTWCLENDVPLLHNDRDFDVMEQHLGLHCWRGE